MERANVDEANLVMGRINTRETSTLTVATLAASVSLVLLALVVPLSTPNARIYHLWLRLAGFLLALLGVLYRETTIHTVDQREYDLLKRLLRAPLRENLLRPNPGRNVRGILFRGLLLSACAVWIELLFDSFFWFFHYSNQLTTPLRISLLPILMWLGFSGSSLVSVAVLSILLWFVFVPAFFYSRWSRLKRGIILMGSLLLMMALFCSYALVVRLLPVGSQAVSSFLFSVPLVIPAGVYVLMASVLLTLRDPTRL